MADFTSSFWGFYIGILTLVGILACALLLWRTSSRRSSGKASTGEPGFTGHRWDETLLEYDNPLPRWWMGLFVITIVFGLGYLALYPGLGAWGGLLDWTSRGKHAQEVAAADAQYGPLFKKFASQPIEELARDPQARAIGERLFLNTCAQCHGSDARGAKGFPNLTDADWLHGGTPADIESSITNGRHGVMPPMLDALGGAEEVRNMAEYVRSLAGAMHDAQRAEQGAAKFAVCAACHGAEGKGNTAIGAPNLTDATWLYGGNIDTIVETITRGRDNQMPAHGAILGPDKVHLLAAWVYGLSAH